VNPEHPLWRSNQRNPEDCKLLILRKTSFDVEIVDDAHGKCSPIRVIEMQAGVTNDTISECLVSAGCVATIVSIKDDNVAVF
jgi:predicted CoA-binding protein